MEQYFKELAKQAGLSEDEIKRYLNDVEIVPTPEQKKDIGKKDIGTNIPDVVSPFDRPVEMSQQFNNYNPFMGYYADTHKGEDFATAEGEQGKFPIGGQITEKGYDPAYGYNIIVRGFNPEEYKQLSAEDFINPQSQPENDSVRLSHLQELPAQEPGEYVATGSGGLKFGSTGNATGPHVDVESFPSGAPEDFDKKRSFTSYYDILLKMIESQ